MKNLNINILYLVTLAVLVACNTQTSISRGPGSISEGAKKEGSKNDPSLSPEFLKARQVIESSCLSCHASGAFSWNIKPGSDESVWINSSPQGLIVPGDASNSRIVKYMIYSQNGIMPYLTLNGPQASPQQFPKSSYDAIVDWINGLDKEAANSGTLTKGTIKVPIEHLKIGDRKYVYQLFADVFGPTGVSDARRLIHNKLMPFGGPCSVGMGFVGEYQYCLHMESKIDDQNGSTAASGFIDAKHYDRMDVVSSDGATNPESSTVREAYRTYTCEKMLLAKSHSATFQGPLYNALQVINDNKNVFEGTPTSSLNFVSYPADGTVPSVSEIRAAYRLFFNYREPSEKIIAAFQKVAQSAKEKISTPANGFPLRFEPWRYLLLTMCLAPETQIQ